MSSNRKFPSRHVHTLKTHNGPVNTVIFSSYPGTYVLTGSTDRAIHLSRALPSTDTQSIVETTQPIQKYEAHGYSILDIAVSSDNSRFSSVGGDRQVFLWDVEQGGTVRRWAGHSSRVEAVQFAGEGDSVVVSGSADTTINLWDTKSNSYKPIQSLTEASDTVSSLHVHMPTYSIASGSYDGRVRIYDLRMGRTTVDVIAHPVTSVRCSADGNAILVSSLDGKIRMLDRTDGKLLKAYGGETQTGKFGEKYVNKSLRLRSVFAKGDAVVLSGSEAADMETKGNASQAAVFVWDVLSGEIIATVPAGEGVKVVSCVAWNEKGQCWAGACADAADDAFGPAVGAGCRDGFDFTLLFEQSILSILPAAIILIASPFRIKYLLSKDIRTQYNPVRIAKLVVGAGLAATQLALLVLWICSAEPRTKSSIPSAALSLIVAAQLVLLSWTEDTRSVRPSSLLSAYLLLSSLFDISQARTLWDRQDRNESVAITFTTSVGLKVIFLVLESTGKRQYLHEEYRSLPPESTSGILNRSFMWWVNRLFLSGFKPEMRGNDAKGQRGALRFHSLFVKHSGGHLFLQYSHVESRGFESKGYGLLGATLLIYIGLAVSNLHYNHMIYRFIAMFRGATSSLIYEHGLNIPDGSLDDRSAAITLMTTDIDRISACLVNLNECWAQSIEVVVGITLLSIRIGWVSIIPVIITILSGVGSIQISKHIGGRQKVWVDAVQRRIAITTSMLTEVQTVRRIGWSNTLAKMIQEKQNEETRRMEGFRWSIVWQNVIQNLPWALAPALTFTVYTSQGNSLDTTKALSSLSIITLLTNPASKLLSAIPSTAASFGCFDRIQKFLLIPSCQGGLELHSTIVEDQLENGSSHPNELSSVELQEVSSTVISFSDVAIRPVASSSIILQDVNFCIPRGSFTFILGQVGSGKSTLLRAILGYAFCEKGLIKVSRHDVAYCAQSSWLPNTTIQDAICGFTDENEHKANLDSKWYEAVIHACALHHDMKLFVNGDRMQIGSASSAVLSGGQMQRIALARALYSRKKILLLDDVLSALDNVTKKLIMARLFGKSGLFRQLNSTVVLVTNETDCLSYANEIFILFNGRLEVSTPDIVGYKHMGLDSLSSNTRVKDPEDAIDSISRPYVKETAAQISKENQLNDLTRATGDRTVYKYYIQSIGWQKILVFVFSVTLHVFCSTFSQIWLEWWAAGNGAQKALYVTVYFMLASFNSFGNGGYVWAILVLISPATSRKLHQRLLNTLMRASPSYLSRTDSGVILNRFSQDIALIEGQLPIGMLVFVSNLVICIATAGLVASGSGYMTITVPFLLIVIILLQNFYLRTSRQLRLLDLESRSPLYSHFMETISGLATIQAFQWQKRFRRKNLQLLDASQRPYYLLYCIQRWLTLVLNLIVAAEAVILVGLVIKLRGSVSVGLIGISLNNILSFSNSLSSVTSGWTQLEISLGSISRIRDFVTNVKPEDDAKTKVQPPAHWPCHGMIEFRKVTAQYSTEKVALGNISFTASPGQKIGICGRTGSGKSSLLATILGILDIIEGSILIDGIDITTLPRETIRERLVTIPQSTLILEGCSIRTNVDPHSIHSDTEIIEALNHVGLWKEVIQQRGGLDAEVKPTSLQLSKGQQQLFGLARAILKVQESTKRGSRPNLLLDEPTSNVDSQTDEKIQILLRQTQCFAMLTVLTVAHRIGTILRSDMVVVLDDGRVVETGDPRELQLRSGSVFAGLVDGDIS
ncbi:vacuolar glutathione S-conjugate transporter [Talaromyces pinophilus]|uniref:Vacuolar glutathione S-conjugate transporter n=1 Tax=Talaromyces pinophilus TaxID=128442 RepID=A0A510NVL6_TALPI|nr:vacuolar glutathione S-conjugate transporter [Talaromyces pinophilus]